MILNIDIPEEIWKVLCEGAKEMGKSEEGLKQQIEEIFKEYFKEIIPVVIQNLNEGMAPEIVNIWQADASFKLSQKRFKEFYEGEQ